MDKILKKDAKRFLANVPEESVFRCCDGRIFRNIEELGQAFSRMRNEDFTYHANTERNDFSKWVKDIMKDEKLARDLAKSQNKSQAAKAIVERISSLRNILKSS